MKPDPTIDEIRRVRHEISAKFDHDIGRLVEYYMKLQDEDQDREAVDLSAPKTDEASQTD